MGDAPISTFPPATPYVPRPLNHPLSDVRMLGVGRPVLRGAAEMRISDAHRRPRLKQQLDDAEKTLMGSQMQRRLPSPGACVRIDPGLQQSSDDLNSAEAGGHVQ